LAKNSGHKEVVPGQIVEARVDVVMLHDVGTPGIQRPFNELGAKKIADNVECIIIPDHFVPAPTVQAAENLKITREFAKRMNVKNYYEIGHGGGICHQVMIEKGHVLPGQIIIAPDTHATTYGCCGAFGTGFGVTDVAIGLAIGYIWLKVPQTVKIVLNGKLKPGVSAKDVSLFLLKEFGESRLIYKAIEFYGPVIEEMSLDGRECMADMALEMGVKTCFMIPDEKTMNYLRQRAGNVPDPVLPDEDACYEETITYDLSGLTPFVAAPHAPSNGMPVKELEGIKIQQAFVGSCTNGRLEDLRITAAVLKGKKVHRDVRLIITPASQEIMKEAVREGIIEALIDSGAMITNPSCGACVGGHLGLIASGEACISTSNRNFKGRMGSEEGQIYLASPLVTALAALNGEITVPTGKELNEVD